MELRIGYNKALAIMFLVVAAFIGITAAVINPDPIQLVMSVVFFALGIVYLRGAVAVVSDKAVDIKNLFGGTAKSVPIESLADVTLNGNSILVGGKKVVAGSMANGADVAKLRSAIEGAGRSD